MSDAVVIPPGGGELVGDTPERRVEILSDDESLNATWSRFGPRRDGADLHVHRHHTDLFYVLDGELTLRLGADDRPVTTAAGTLVGVPPLVVHGFRNGTDRELRYLNFHAPGQQFAEYLRAMRDGREFSYDQHDPPADGGRSPGDAAVGDPELVSAGDRLRVLLLADVEDVGIAEVWSQPGAAAPPAHVHRRHVESFYVLEGALMFRVSDREIRAEAGSWVQVPRGVPHTFAIDGDAPARFLDVHSPSCGFGDFVRGLHRAETDEELAAVRAAFDQEPA